MNREGLLCDVPYSCYLQELYCEGEVCKQVFKRKWTSEEDLMLWNCCEKSSHAFTSLCKFHRHLVITLYCWKTVGLSIGAGVKVLQMHLVKNDYSYNGCKILHSGIILTRTWLKAWSWDWKNNNSGDNGMLQNSGPTFHPAVMKDPLLIS